MSKDNDAKGVSPPIHIFILNGQAEGNSITLTAGKYTVGRANSSDIILPEDLYISGNHADLKYYANGRLTITDKNSSNGTYLLGEPVKTTSVVNPGDIIRVGRTFLKVSRRSQERLYSGDEISGTPEAIVVVDLVGSSKIAQAMGDGVASKVKNFLFQKLKTNLSSHPTEFMKNTGDGFMLIFRNVNDAIEFSRDFMCDITSTEDGGYRGIHIRIGIHYGETFATPDGDRRGLAVDMAFRIESVKLDNMHQTVVGIKKVELPRADRIFVSEVVYQLIANSKSFKTRCIGYFDLKHFTGRHKIYEVLF